MQRLVTTGRDGKLAVRLWHVGLSPEDAKRLGVTKREIETALLRHEAMDYDVPTFDGEFYLMGDLALDADEAIDELRKAFGFSKSEAETLLEVARLEHRALNA